MGNTNFEIGVHIAAALPEVSWLEYSFLSYNQLIETPIEFRDGYALVPGRALPSNVEFYGGPEP